jgi:cytochrome c biogenesis protein
LNGTDVRTAPRRQRTAGAVLLEFLGSMNLAITLLMALAIASVIGTVLQQNQPYPDYIVKFGPFWFEVYRALGLYDVYSAGWFLVILAFLVISTSVCIYRNAPHMLRDMRQYRMNVQQNSLRGFHHRAEWRAARPPAEALEQASAHLAAHGYRVRRKDHAEHTVLAAMRGGSNRLGYIFTHVAIVIICVGGLLDGNMPLKVAELRGNIEVETRDIPASQVPAASRLPASNRSFRGSVTVPEGSAAGVVFLNLRDGYLVQELPFTIELKEFRVEYYHTGQPRSFESDLVIHDDALAEPLEQTIAVNHPLVYKGHSIYQASFGDGGSRLRMKAWPLIGGLPQEPVELEGAVHQNLPLEMHGGPITLELTDFRLYNINPVEEGDESGRQFRNFGPSFVFKLRNAAGEALEYENYMLPVEQEGRAFFITGMRESLAAPFRYLHIPAGPDRTLDRFLRYHALTHQPERVREVATHTAAETLSAAGVEESVISSVASSMVRLIALFGEGGFDAIAADVDATVPEERRTEVMGAYLRVLQNILGALYVELLAEEGVDVSAGVTVEDTQFFDDAVNALSALHLYASPFFLQLAGFEQVEASGLQITKAPGKNVVYVGFILLMVGIFIMFYVAHRRLWVWVDAREGHTRLLLAGTTNRDQYSFGREFEGLRRGLAARVGEAAARPESAAGGTASAAEITLPADGAGTSRHSETASGHDER